jgi:elongation factor G
VTRCATINKQIILESIEFPAPVISVAIEPKTKADQDKLGVAMQRLAQEDPTFRVSHRTRHRPDADLGYGRIAPGNHRGPHAAEYNVQANVGRPQVRIAKRFVKKPRPKANTSSRPAGAGSTGTR